MDGDKFVKHFISHINSKNESLLEHDGQHTKQDWEKSILYNCISVSDLDEILQNPREFSMFHIFYSDLIDLHLSLYLIHQLNLRVKTLKNQQTMLFGRNRY